MSEDNSRQWTVRMLLEWTKAYFDRGGVDCPRLSAEVLLAHCLECGRLELYTRFDTVPADPQRKQFRRLVLRAAGHEPVAYLVGRKEFYSLDFEVTPDVLVPRSETEILASEAIRHLRSLKRPGRLWDACTGSGCVAVAVAANVPDVTVLATDVSAPAIAVAARNAELHSLAGRVHCRVADLLTLPERSPVAPPFDVITANPPYVAAGGPVGRSVRHEPKVALFAGPDGMDFLPRVIQAAPPMLAPGGAIIVEFGYDQADRVRDCIAAGGGFCEPKILRDQQQIERVAVAIRR